MEITPERRQARACPAGVAEMQRLVPVVPVVAEIPCDRRSLDEMSFSPPGDAIKK
jgi:hypothetical protein